MTIAYGYRDSLLILGRHRIDGGVNINGGHIPIDTVRSEHKETFSASHRTTHAAPAEKVDMFNARASIFHSGGNLTPKI